MNTQLESNNQQEPFISICLLTYKRANILPRSLDSLLAQSYQNFELIINDDCSPDNTTEIAKKYEYQDLRVRYFRNEKNLRYAGNQNAALSRARSDLVAIVHDGDIYTEDCIAKWVEVMQINQNVGIVYNASDALDESGEIVKKYRHTYPRIMSGKVLLDDMFRLYSSPIFGIVMLRKKFVEIVGPFDKNYPVLADVDMWMRLLLISDVAYIDEPLYQIHPREVNHVNRGVNWAIIQEHHQIFQSNAERTYKENPKKLYEILRRINRKHHWQILQGLLWCVKRRQWRLAAEGCQYLTTSQNFWLQSLGSCLGPILYKVSKVVH